MTSASDASFRSQLKMLSEKGTRPFNPLLNVNLRPFYSRRVLLTCTCLFFLTLLLHYAYDIPGSYPLASPEIEQQNLRPEPAHDYEARGSFRPLRIKGFENTGIPGGEYVGKNLSCSSLAHAAEIGVQESFHLRDDFLEIAAELDSHPMIDYSKSVAKMGSGAFSLSKILATSWDRLATACVWMPDHRVYLCVSRIIFHPGTRKDRCLISFLRGQIYSESWIHLDRYRLKWKDQEIVFPKAFDTDTEYSIGGELYGPEDARIIIEEGVEDAEPVIVFNMISSRSDWKRAMWIFRPFSQQARILTIRGTDRPKKEKNWAPFFVRELDENVNSTTPRQPSTHIHFIWRFEPLTVLKCQLSSGMCDIVFAQTVSENLISQHGDRDGSLRGGTQLVAVPLPDHRHLGSSLSSSGLQAFAAFPRTHVENAGGCRKAVYRPEMIVLLTNSTHFYLSYGSEAIDFGAGIVMDPASLADPCERGRIMITNSIARWDMNARNSLGEETDVMTLTLSVDDATVQVLRLSGIWELIRTLPSMDAYFAQTKPMENAIRFPAISKAGEDEFSGPLESIDPFDRATAVGWDIRACLEESAWTYVGAHKQRPSEEEIKKAEEKRKEEEKKKQQQAEQIKAEEEQKKKQQEAEKKKAEEEKKKKQEAEKKKAEEEEKKKKQEAENKKTEEEKKKQEEAEKKKEEEEQARKLEEQIMVKEKALEAEATRTEDPKSLQPTTSTHEKIEETPPAKNP